MVWLFPGNTPVLDPLIFSTHFTSREKLGWPKARDRDTCPQQDPGEMTRIYKLVMNQLGPVPEGRLWIIGHPYIYAKAKPNLKQFASFASKVADLGFAVERGFKHLLPDPTRVLREPLVFCNKVIWIFWGKQVVLFTLVRMYIERTEFPVFSLSLQGCKLPELAWVFKWWIRGSW